MHLDATKSNKSKRHTKWLGTHLTLACNPPVAQFEKNCFKKNCVRKMGQWGSGLPLPVFLKTSGLWWDASLYTHLLFPQTAPLKGNRNSRMCRDPDEYLLSLVLESDLASWNHGWTWTWRISKHLNAGYTRLLPWGATQRRSDLPSIWGQACWQCIPLRCASGVENPSTHCYECHG